MLVGTAVDYVPEREARTPHCKVQDFVESFYYSGDIIWEVKWKTHYLNSTSAAASVKYGVKKKSEKEKKYNRIKVINRDNRVFMVHL